MMDYRGNFVGGQWRAVVGGQGVLVRENPCRKSENVYEFPWGVRAVDEAVGAARGALRSWDRLGVSGRRPFLERFRAAIEGRKDALARVISLETGKPLWESVGEMSAVLGKFDIMSGEGLAYTADVHPVGLVGGSFRARPLGVVAVLGPFNFPLHLPNGHIVPALLSGNTVVVKPSELTAASMQMYFECVEEAGFPEGVVNMVQGPGAIGAALGVHEDVDGVLFTGSYETGLRIQQATMLQHWKLLALEMGGKNTSIVLDDANLEQSVYEILQAACLTTGQRCSATSRVVLKASIADKFLEQFVDAVGRVTMGDAFSEDCFMGPLVSKGGYDKFMAAQLEDEGGNLTKVLAGGAARADLDGYFVKPAIWRAKEVNKEGRHQGAEIFGPDIIVYVAKDDEEAVRIANATDYGLAMSVFTADAERFEDLSYDLQTGILNLNRSTVGASSRLPFGGVKKSGNHRPSAVLAGRYCTYPQAQLREVAGWDSDLLNAGVLGRLRR